MDDSIDKNSPCAGFYFLTVNVAATIATNLAGYFAHRGCHTPLLDYDPQGSATKWLIQRPKDKSTIHGIAALKTEWI